MSLWRALAHGLLCFLFSILFAQSATQRPATNVSVPRVHITQDQLCCFDIEFVNPTYPREARLAHVEGVAKLILVIGTDNSIAELRAVSGDPVLVDAAMKAVRQWRIHHMFGGTVAGQPAQEVEVPLSFTFRIRDAPKPAYLHLANGKVIRADEVREFTNGIEYAVGKRTHRISAADVTTINACADMTKITKPNCVPAGAPSFDIVAMPLLPADKAAHLSRSPSH